MKKQQKPTVPDGTIVMTSHDKEYLYGAHTDSGSSVVPWSASGKIFNEIGTLMIATALLVGITAVVVYNPFHHEAAEQRAVHDANWWTDIRDKKSSELAVVHVKQKVTYLEWLEDHGYNKRSLSKHLESMIDVNRVNPFIKQLNSTFPSFKMGKQGLLSTSTCDEWPAFHEYVLKKIDFSSF